MLEHGFGLSQAWNLRGWFDNFTAHLGYAYVLSGRVAEAVSLLERLMGPDVSLIVLDVPWGMAALWVAYRSEAYLLAGRRDEAIQLVEWALTAPAEHYSRGWQVLVLRLLGDIHAQSDPPEVEPAEVSYRRALTLAEELGMRPLQAHCHRGLGTLYATIGQQDRARTALSSALALYHDMDMTFWVPQTEATLAQVG
jgi:tetratricopeptide (TPR) repeat protein